MQDSDKALIILLGYKFDDELEAIWDLYASTFNKIWSDISFVERYQLFLILLEKCNNGESLDLYLKNKYHTTIIVENHV